MENYITAIEELWQTRDTISKNKDQFAKGKPIIDDIISLLDQGRISVSYKKDGQWLVNEWVKKAILLSFKTSEMRIFDGNFAKWYDKIEPKFANGDEDQIKQSNSRFVPGAYIRKGAFIGKNVVVMPSFINIGAHVGDGSLIDTWATVGSCAYIGKNCHISGGTGIGGVLEPLQANPVIIEDNCFIGARSEIAEGVLIEEGSVISMGVFIGASTKIVNRSTGEIIFGKIPAYSVVVPGYVPAKEHGIPGLSCAVIVKQVDQKTRQKTSINELLREL
ncbi:MAG: 2,3,4,5-tetrahydropyridine-2,6-dicarboxylate N-succinyltransferase [Rickettsiaceae bacterium]|jgi:2,3,4,5-tetrahydropyridine-2-carboxylate N-succinyltransferase|nr:2,3,4,5-tetrahydropyridine-2,6-dicarboxylate N-succinyltransferase [Rickettsiaceae bacterium]